MISRENACTASHHVLDISQQPQSLHLQVLNVAWLQHRLSPSAKSIMYAESSTHLAVIEDSVKHRAVADKGKSLQLLGMPFLHSTTSHGTKRIRA